MVYKPKFKDSVIFVKLSNSVSAMTASFYEYAYICCKMQSCIVIRPGAKRMAYKV